MLWIALGFTQFLRVIAIVTYYRVSSACRDFHLAMVVVSKSLKASRLLHKKRSLANSKAPFMNPKLQQPRIRTSTNLLFKYRLYSHRHIISTLNSRMMLMMYHWMMMANREMAIHVYLVTRCMGASMIVVNREADGIDAMMGIGMSRVLSG
jgi:hypothetical protein